MWDAPIQQGGLGALLQQAFGAPTGVVSSADIDASGADLLVTYENVGDVSFWGADLALEAFLDDRWTLGGTVSWVQEDFFFIDDGEPIALNAPKFKGSVSLAFRNAGFNAEGRLRHIAEFPAQSAGYVGTQCVSDPSTGTPLLTDPCVEAKTLVDLNLGYQVPRSRATLQLTVSDIFNTGYASFVGVPEIGRFAMFRIKYDLN
jgi:iron complex outermembrane receptor protein